MDDLYINIAKYLLALKDQVKKVGNGSFTMTVIIKNGVAVTYEQTTTTHVPLNKGGAV